MFPVNSPSPTPGSGVSATSSVRIYDRGHRSGLAHPSESTNVLWQQAPEGIKIIAKNAGRARGQ